jgi:hypothetical protein
MNCCIHWVQHPACASEPLSGSALAAAVSFCPDSCCPPWLAASWHPLSSARWRCSGGDCKMLRGVSYQTSPKSARLHHTLLLHHQSRHPWHWLNRRAPSRAGRWRGEHSQQHPCTGPEGPCQCCCQRRCWSHEWGGWGAGRKLSELRLGQLQLMTSLWGQLHLTPPEMQRQIQPHPYSCRAIAHSACRLQNW